MKPLRKWLEDKARRYRYEKYFWWSNLPVIIALYFFAPGVWQKISILYLAIVSIWALALTAGGAEQASEAAGNITDDSKESS